VAELVFDYAGHETKLSVIADLVGKSGWLRLDKLTVSALDTVESLLFTAITDDGKSLDQEACEKLFSVQAKKSSNTTLAEPPPLLANNQQRRIEASLAQFIEENQRLFNAEREKLERWADDKLLASEEALRDTKAKIAQVKRDARKAPTLEEQSDLQNQLRNLSANNGVNVSKFLMWKMKSWPSAMSSLKRYKNGSRKPLKQNTYLPFAGKLLKPMPTNNDRILSISI
jgi:hypothetical protein